MTRNGLRMRPRGTYCNSGISPFLTLFSSRDPITRGGDKIFLKLVPGAANQPHAVTRGAGHFLQEDKGPELARKISDFIATTLSVALPWTL